MRPSSVIARSVSSRPHATQGFTFHSHRLIVSNMPARLLHRYALAVWSVYFLLFIIEFADV
jgi:hypothetical protein